MGKDRADSSGVENRPADSPSSLRRLDVERFAERFGIRSEGGCFIVQLPSGTSAIEIVGALREAGRCRADCGNRGPGNVGVALEVMGNQIARQCAQGGFEQNED